MKLLHNTKIMILLFVLSTKGFLYCSDAGISSGLGADLGINAVKALSSDNVQKTLRELGLSSTHQLRIALERLSHAIESEQTQKTLGEIGIRSIQELRSIAEILSQMARSEELQETSNNLATNAFRGTLQDPATNQTLSDLGKNIGSEALDKLINAMQNIVPNVRKLAVVGLGFVGALYSLSLVKKGIENYFDSTKENDKNRKKRNALQHTAVGLCALACSIYGMYRV